MQDPSLRGYRRQPWYGNGQYTVAKRTQAGNLNMELEPRNARGVAQKDCHAYHSLRS